MLETLFILIGASIPMSAGILFFLLLDWGIEDSYVEQGEEDVCKDN